MCVVVIVDEAHLLATDQLEELRLPTNAEMDSQGPFALLLVGPPTQLRLGVFAALDQRSATRYQLALMDLTEAAQHLRMTWRSSVGPIRCLPMTPSHGCTSSAWACRAHSTMPPLPR
jgi:type II secretory pathway predicted ATPase ExeA